MPLHDLMNASSPMNARSGLSYQYIKGTWTADENGKITHEQDATLNMVRTIIVQGMGVGEG